ncbi:MAG TPA: hypothetical protein VFA83_09910 [Acidimicrobiales bacterium]|nr:hypothetical protein [Acidimicrobiales bacterium]
MLGRKDYTKDELANATKTVNDTLAAYKKLAKAVEASGDAKARAALEAFEPVLFRDLALTLDRLFVHRIRKVAGNDNNPLNEVELITESILAGAPFTTNNVLKYAPEESVTGLKPGDKIDLTAEEFERLAKAFLADIKAKFV